MSEAPRRLQNDNADELIGDDDDMPSIGGFAATIERPRTSRGSSASERPSLATFDADAWRIGTPPSHSSNEDRQQSRDPVHSRGLAPRPLPSRRHAPRDPQIVEQSPPSATERLTELERQEPRHAYSEPGLVQDSDPSRYERSGYAHTAASRQRRRPGTVTAEPEGVQRRRRQETVAAEPAGMRKGRSGTLMPPAPAHGLDDGAVQRSNEQSSTQPSTQSGTEPGTQPSTESTGESSAQPHGRRLSLSAPWARLIDVRSVAG